MTDINEILKERNSVHGNFDRQAELSQDLKDLVRSGISWNKMSGAQKESVDMILFKISRIVTGTPSFEDHWIDIQGYAKIGNTHEA